MKCDIRLLQASRYGLLTVLWTAPPRAEW